MPDENVESGRARAVKELTAPESVDNQMVSLMRLILSLSATTIIYIDPSEPDRFVALTYLALVLYSLYSIVLYFLSVRRKSQSLERVVPWVDIACYLVLISLSSGTNSIFFFFFFFAILVASFREGFRAGLQVAIVSALLFTLVGFATAPPVPSFAWNRFLLRPIYLLVLGYMMAYWGGRELKLKRQLSLLKEVTGLANPRFGIAHTLGSVMRRLRAFYDADACSLVWSDAQAAEHYLITIKRETDGEPTRAEQIPAPLAQLLRRLPESLSVVYNGRHTPGIFQEPTYYASDSTTSARSRVGREECAALAARFEAESLVSVPLHFHGKIVGRLYLAGRRGIFARSDVDFLEQIIEQMAPVLDNIRLLERLASNAAEQERQRLARDIHDSVIQPYLGLQYRLAAIRNKLASGDIDIAADIERLFQSTAEEVAELRGFVRGLKDSGERSGDLISAVRRFAAQFSENYDIEVAVECGANLKINDRLAAEMIRFVHEGLSNIRKHTRATRSVVRLECDAGACLLRIENNGAVEGEGARFTPRSLAERARELGGQTHIEQAGGDRTIVTIEIPL